MSGRLDCMYFISDCLGSQMKERDTYDGLEWVEAERLAVVDAANLWVQRHGGNPVTVADVERVEPRAVGHVDYQKKFSLYVAELVCP